MKSKWLVLTIIVLVAVTGGVLFNKMGAEEPNPDDPHAMAKVWERKLPKVLKITESVAVVPLWNADGTTVQIFDSKLSLDDKEKIEERLDRLQELLVKHQFYRGGKLTYIFGEQDSSAERPFTIVEHARFERGS